MEIEVRLFAGLRQFAQQNEKIELDDGKKVSDLLERLGIPPSKVAIILVNGRHAEQDQPLQDGETVSLFPAIAGG
jgi:molybdopterin converting factor small subunit